MAHDGEDCGADGVAIRRGRVRLAGWVSDTRGVYRLEVSDPLLGWQEVLPDVGRFTHLTAAARHGLWLPPLPAATPVLAAVDRRCARPQRRGLHVSRHEVLPVPLVLDGVRVDPLPHVLLACARDLTLVDLVVLIDSALRLGLRRGDVEALAAGRRRGAPALRRALSLSDPRSESAYETLLRLLHVLCGVHVEPQRRTTEADGFLVARSDLWLVGTNAVHEYDGAHHLTSTQQAKDLRRRRLLDNAGMVCRGYTSHDVLRMGVTILRDADLSLGRPHDPSRIRPWHDELRRSLFTPAGRARLAARLSPDRPGASRPVAG